MFVDCDGHSFICKLCDSIKLFEGEIEENFPTKNSFISV